ncbi:unnamed protein product [Symbiodinium pilosum]|uniref:Uncharacterized protein n=1 Tax=Symbiodinium pilosum TaxID=2952 RepID=A0A812PP82_SYMPI|nr:unnamed protein product [Symbiodinium pilosum]
MAPLPSLDEDIDFFRVKGYVTEPKACLSCKPWKNYLYDALKLEAGSMNKQESVGFNFQFFRNGTYRLAWTRTYDAWSSQGEQHYGKWHTVMDHVCCETLEPPVEAQETEMRYAPAGYKFAVPIEDILSAQGPDVA